MDFHPTVSILASGSKDCSIRLFDYSKPSAKRAYQVVQEVAPVRCVCFHPSGDYMIVGTEQCTCKTRTCIVAESIWEINFEVYIAIVFEQWLFLPDIVELL